MARGRPEYDQAGLSGRPGPIWVAESMPWAAIACSMAGGVRGATVVAFSTLAPHSSGLEEAMDYRPPSGQACVGGRVAGGSSRERVGPAAARSRHEVRGAASDCSADCL